MIGLITPEIILEFLVNIILTKLLMNILNLSGLYMSSLLLEGLDCSHMYNVYILIAYH